MPTGQRTVLRMCVVCRTALLRLAHYRYLVGDAGADKDLKDAEGQTALYFAAEKGHLEVVQCAAARHLAAELGLQGCQPCLLDTALTTQ